MDTVQKQFTDDATGIPLIYAQLPSSFQCRARLRQIQKGNESSLFLQGMAVRPVTPFRMNGSLMKVQEH